jgi:hypothetical protein
VAIKHNADLRPIAEIILPMVLRLKSNPDSDLRSWCLSVLDIACRHIEEFVIPEVSIRAHREAEALGLGDLSTYRWTDQTDHMGDKGRRVFHWEHVLPVSEMKRRLLAISEPDINEIVYILKSADVAWILKEEDADLTRLKLSQRRDGNPWDAYRKAGIEMRNKLAVNP